MDIEFDNITYEVTKGWHIKNGDKVKLLEGVSGMMKRGELTAIIGPSGSGKTTLMNVLAGHKMNKVVCGKVRCNGQPRDLDEFRRLSCYIMQEDLLPVHLTVMECMMVAARLKISGDISRKGKQNQVVNILTMLGLQSTSNMRTSALSGGERKRLSIALELVYNQPIMFFDEPTSGLDSLSCAQCVQLLKALALNGKTIICTMHQASAFTFELFDSLYILAKGRCMYKGSRKALLVFLERHRLNIPQHHNPADYVIEVVSGLYGHVNETLMQSVTAGICEQIDLQLINENGSTNATEQVSQELTNKFPKFPNFQFSKLPRKVVFQEISTISSQVVESLRIKNLQLPMCKSVECVSTNYNTGFCNQFFILLARAFRSIMRDSVLTLIRLICHICFALLVGLLYADIGNEATKAVNNVSFLLVNVLFLVITAMCPTLLTFPQERLVLMREHLNYWYSLTAYYFAKTTADVPFQVVLTIVYSTMVYFMTGQRCAAQPFLAFTLFCVLVSLVAQSWGLLIGAVASEQVATFVGPMSITPIVLFSGFFITFANIPSYLQILSYLSFMRYMYEGLMISTYGFDRPPLHCTANDVISCMYSDPKHILDVFDANSIWWLDALVLLVFFILIRIACYCVLRYQVISSR